MESIEPQEELFHIQESTNDDGTVDVEITDWEKGNNRVVVEYQLPSIETKEECMEWPTKDTTDNKFVRLVRDCGYSIASADQIISHKVKYDTESGKLVVTKKKFLYEKIISLTDGFSLHHFNPIFTLLYPLLSFPFMFNALFNDDFDLPNNADARGVLVGAVVWPMALILLLVFKYII